MSADFAALDAVGLNLHAVLDLARLPPELLSPSRKPDGPARYRQLILIGNAGPALWASVQAAGQGGPDPIDDFSIACVERWFLDRCGDAARRRLYPGDAPIDLQALGRLAGWHHDSPLMLGILPRWGTWFGYRVALLADSALPPTPPLQATSPCQGCRERPCVAGCPASAVGERFSLQRCIDYRQAPASRCAGTCLARLSCPVGADQRYPEEQIAHSYAISLAAIGRYHGHGEH